MGSSIRHHFSAMVVARNLRASADEAGDIRERLAQGQRIIDVSDDAAGLQVANRLKSESQLAGVAIRNVNEGISAVRLATQAWTEIAAVLTEMGNIAAIAAAGPKTLTQQQAFNSQIVALASEVERIATTTKYNGMTLLSGTTSLSLQVQFASYSGSQIQVRALGGQLQELGLASAGRSDLNYSLVDPDPTQAMYKAETFGAAVQAALSEVSSRRGMLGASEDRLHTAVRTLNSAIENFAVAEGRIRDIDKAEETAKLVGQQMLQERGTALLAQANQEPSIVSALLSDSGSGGSDDIYNLSQNGGYGSLDDKRVGAFEPKGLKGISIAGQEESGLFGGERNGDTSALLLLNGGTEVGTPKTAEKEAGRIGLYGGQGLKNINVSVDFDV